MGEKENRNVQNLVDSIDMNFAFYAANYCKTLLPGLEKIHEALHADGLNAFKPNTDDLALILKVVVMSLLTIDNRFSVLIEEVRRIGAERNKIAQEYNDYVKERELAHEKKMRKELGDDWKGGES